MIVHRAQERQRDFFPLHSRHPHIAPIASLTAIWQLACSFCATSSPSQARLGRLLLPFPTFSSRRARQSIKATLSSLMGRKFSSRVVTSASCGTALRLPRAACCLDSGCRCLMSTPSTPTRRPPDLVLSTSCCCVERLSLGSKQTYQKLFFSSIIFLRWGAQRKHRPLTAAFLSSAKCWPFL